MWFVEAAIISGVERLALLMSFGSLIVALLVFLDRDRKNRRKNNAPPVRTTGDASLIER